MHEPIFRLKTRADIGIEEAVKEIESRKQSQIALPLYGIHGEKICFSLTNEIREKIDSVQILYQRVLDKNDRIEDILIDAYYSATIEGARTSLEQVKKVFSNPKTKDDRMVVNCVKAYEYAYETDIHAGNIKELWDIIVDGVCENESKAGDLYRAGMVYIGNSSGIIHVPAAADQIAGMMDQLFSFLRNSEMDPLIKAFILQFYFVYVHPFCDGNGRMARIFTSSYLYHHGYEKIQYLPLSEGIYDWLFGYYRRIKDSEWVYEEDGNKYLDITTFVDYMLQVTEDCIVASFL